jgi:hypothetical protein
MMEEKEIILLVAVAVAVIVAGAYIYPSITGNSVAADQVDIIPDIDISECMSLIRSTNPEMSTQAASDNCYSIEAVNENDPSICNQVSEGFRANCLAQF